MDQNRSRIFSRLTLLLATAGILASAITLYEHLVFTYSKQLGIDVETPFCKVGAGFNCQSVIGSDYAQFLGISLSHYGLAFYGILFLLAVASFDDRVLSKRTFANVAFFFSFLAVLVSLSLFLISKVMIGSLCPLCLSMYLINFLLFITTYLAGRDEAWFHRVGNGLVKVVTFPRVLFSGANGGVWLAITAFAAWLCFMIALPDFLSIKLVAPQLQNSQVRGQQAAALAAWDTEPVSQIDLKLDDAFGDYSEGPKDAPIKVVEFSDFQCPACRAAHQELQPLKEQLDGRILFIHKNFPLDKNCNRSITEDFHEHACFAAEFARCAGEQGKFWQAADFLYSVEALERRGDSEAVQQEVLGASSSLGLDRSAIEACLASGRQKARIQEDIAEGERLQLEGTPSFWINGKKVGIATAQVFEELFARILHSSGK